MKNKIPNNVKNIMHKLIIRGFEAYIVGGAVRDLVWGLEPHDFDIFTNANGTQLLTMFPDGNVLGGEERQEKILTVIVDGIEVSQYRKDGPRQLTGTDFEKHLKTCDFTINNLAMDVNGNVIGDRSDLDKRILRFVGNPKTRIEEDQLRLLRGIRFALKYDLEDYTPITNNLYHLTKVPKERIMTELKKIFSLDYKVHGFSLKLHNYIHELFMVLLPAYTRCVDVDGGPMHNETVDMHLHLTMQTCWKLSSNPLLRLATFLHDVGKADTYSKDIKGVHFYGHDKVGCDLVNEFMRTFKFSNEDAKYVSTIVRTHMHVYTDSGKKGFIRLFNSLDENKVPIMDYVIQIYSDNQGNLAKPRINFNDHDKVHYYLEKYHELKHSNEPYKVSELVIKGKDIMKRFDLKPGPRVGKLLKRLHEEVLEGNVRNHRGDLLTWLKNNVDGKPITPENKKELVIFVGLPGSGKSTYYTKNYLGKHVHINLDTLKTRAKEWRMFNAAVDSGLPIVIDNTNMTKELRKRYIDVVKGKYEINCMNFMTIPRETCEKRNNSREQVVPLVAFDRFESEYEEPTKEEGFDMIVNVV